MDAGLKGVNGCMSAHVAWVGAVFGVCRGGGGVVVQRRRGSLGKIITGCPADGQNSITDQIINPNKRSF